jgi:Spy/CpxP family protein refolding chaperone
MKLRAALALGCAAALAAISTAQMGAVTITGKFMMYMKPEVKKELKISKEQDKRINAGVQEAAKSMQERGAAGIDFTNIYKPMDDALLAELDEVQKARLDEIYLQYNGAAVLRFEERAVQFGLTDEQKAAVKPINKKLDDDAMAALRSGGSDPMKKVRPLVKAANDEILEKLTPEQRDAWTKALGKELKIKS